MRAPWVDAWKGLLILLVVVGHVVGMTYHFVAEPKGKGLEFVYKCIYTFHMPAFFFLSGYVSSLKRSVAKEVEPFAFVIAKRSKRLLVPYFAWGLVSAAIFLAMSGVVTSVTQGASTGYYANKTDGGGLWTLLISLAHAGGWPNGEGFRCNSVLWFLPTMFMVLLFKELITRLTNRMISRWRWCRYWRFMACSLFFVVGGAMRIYSSSCLPWGLSNAPFYLSFLLLGELMPELRDVGAVKVLTGWLVFIVINYYLPQRGLAWHHWHWYLVQGIMAFCGCVLSLFSARILCNFSILRKFGVASLGIMLCHKFIILPFQLLFSKSLIISSVSFVGVVVLVAGVSCSVTLFAWLTAILVKRYLPWAIGEKR